MNGQGTGKDHPCPLTMVLPDVHRTAREGALFSEHWGWGGGCVIAELAVQSLSACDM